MHNNNCACELCTRIDELNAKGKLRHLFIEPTGKTDFADVVAKPATYYYDAELIAKKPVTLYKSPDVTSGVKNSFPKGANVGTIDFHVVRNGQVWWHIMGYNKEPLGYLPHEKGLFDTDIIEQTASGSVFDTKMTELKQNQETLPPILQAGSDVVKGATSLVSGIGETATSLGKNLRLILIVVLCLVLIGGVLYSKKANLI